MPQRTHNMGVNPLPPFPRWLTELFIQRTVYRLSSVLGLYKMNYKQWECGLWWVKSASANFELAVHHLKCKLKSDYVLLNVWGGGQHSRITRLLAGFLNAWFKVFITGLSISVARVNFGSQIIFIPSRVGTLVPVCASFSATRFVCGL